MFHVDPIPAFNDNYIWCIRNQKNGHALIVDPGDAKPVFEFIDQHGLKLKAILVTHHHPDHVGGVEALVSKYSCDVYGFAEANLPFLDYRFADGDAFELMGLRFEVLEVPGHTLDHIAFYVPPASKHETPWLFCGDTLFSGGCGRLFEGTPEQMYNSLASLTELPDQTQVYCAHEYTLANLKFARSLLPENADLQHHQKECESLRKQNVPTVPSTIRLEKTINPFLRSRDPELIHSLEKNLSKSLADPVSVFAETRRAKDNF